MIKINLKDIIGFKDVYLFSYDKGIDIRDRINLIKYSNINKKIIISIPDYVYFINRWFVLGLLENVNYKSIYIESKFYRIEEVFYNIKEGLVM